MTPKLLVLLILAQILSQEHRFYGKNPKISDTRKFAVIALKVEQYGFSLE